MPETPIFSLNDVEVFENEHGKQMSGKMINHINDASKLLSIEPEKIKAFVMVAIVDDPEQNFRLHHFATSRFNRLAVYSVLPSIQKMLMENFKKELTQEGLE